VVTLVILQRSMPKIFVSLTPSNALVQEISKYGGLVTGEHIAYALNCMVA